MESESLLSLSNPLSTPEQLLKSSSQLDGIPVDLESSIRFAGAQLTQAAGILLRLPQEIVAQAIVVFLRFYTGPEGGSFRINAAKVCFRHSVSNQVDLTDNNDFRISLQLQYTQSLKPPHCPRALAPLSMSMPTSFRAGLKVRSQG